MTKKIPQLTPTRAASLAHVVPAQRLGVTQEVSIEDIRGAFALGALALSDTASQVSFDNSTPNLPGAPNNVQAAVQAIVDNPPPVQQFMNRPPPSMTWLSDTSIQVGPGSYRNETDTSDIIFNGNVDLTGLAPGVSVHRHVLAGIGSNGLPTAILSTTNALPTGWLRYRRVGSVVTNPTGAIQPFVQRGDRIVFTDLASSPLDISSAPADHSNGIDYTVLAPPVAGVMCDVRATFLSASGNKLVLVTGGLTSEVDTSDGSVIPTPSLTTLSTSWGDFEMALPTDSTARVRVVSSTASLLSVRLQILGWFDPRGRDN